MKKLLLENEADVNAALHAAATEGDFSVVKELLKKGADCNVKDNDNQTPLDVAIANDHKDIVEMMQAKLNPGNKHGRHIPTALTRRNTSIL
jgi:ankyrin repeat protein